MNEKPSDIARAYRRRARRLRREAGGLAFRQLAHRRDRRVRSRPAFTHIPVNREEWAVGLCAGAYMGAMGSAALMGASGFMTVIYAITKINYTYESRCS